MFATVLVSFYFLVGSELSKSAVKGTGSPYKLKVYYLYHNSGHNSGHCTHNPVNWQ